MSKHQDKQQHTTPLDDIFLPRAYNFSKNLYFPVRPFLAYATSSMVEFLDFWEYNV